MDQLFTLIGPDSHKVVGAMSCGVIKHQLAHVFHMPPIGSAASSSRGIGPPGRPIPSGHQLATADMPQQQLQRSAIQSQIDQLQLEMAHLQHQ